MHAYLRLFVLSASIPNETTSATDALRNPFALPFDDLDDYCDDVLNTYKLGEFVGGAWQIERVMRWTPALVEPSDAGVLLRSSGLFKVRGAVVEAVVGGIFHQHVRRPLNPCHRLTRCRAAPSRCARSTRVYCRTWSSFSKSPCARTRAKSATRWAATTARSWPTPRQSSRTSRRRSAAGTRRPRTRRRPTRRDKSCAPPRPGARTGGAGGRYFIGAFFFFFLVAQH